MSSSLNPWESAIQSDYNKWVLSRKPSQFQKYSDACAAYLCSEDFEKSGAHWFCGSQKIHNYATSSLLIYAYDTSSSEVKRFSDDYYRRFSKMLSKCVNCRISYQCSIQGLIEMLIDDVKANKEGAVFLLKELQRRDISRLSREIVEPENLVYSLSEIMWCERWIVSGNLFYDTLVAPGIFTSKYVEVLEELVACPGFLVLALNGDNSSREVAFNHFNAKIVPQFDNIGKDSTKVAVFRRMFNFALKSQLAKPDNADIALFRTSLLLKSPGASSQLRKLLFDCVLKEINSCHGLDLGLGVHSLLETLTSLNLHSKNIDESNSADNSCEISIENFNRLAVAVTASSKFVENRSDAADDSGDSSPGSVTAYKQIHPSVCLRWFVKFCNYQLLSSCNVNDFVSIAVYLYKSCSSIKVEIINSVFDLMTKQPSRYCSVLFHAFKEDFIHNFRFLTNDSIVALWSYHLSSNTRDLSVIAFWKECLTTVAFSRQASTQNGLTLVKNILQESGENIIPKQDELNSEHQVTLNSVLKGMLESVLDMAIPSQINKVLSDNMALKTLLLMYSRQDEEMSLAAEEFIKQGIDDVERDSMVAALVHWNVVVVLHTINDILGEAARSQVKWLPIVPGVYTLTLKLFDEIYSTRDGIDTTINPQITQSIQKLWEFSWILADSILKNIREWHRRFDVLVVLTSSLDFCNGLLQKFRLIDADLCMSMPTNNGEKSWGEMLVSPPIMCVNDMSDMLRLNKPHLLQNAVSVIVQILDLMRSFKVPIPEIMKLLFEDLASGNKTSVLTDSQLRDLLLRCGLGEPSISAKLHQRATGRKTAKDAPTNAARTPVVSLATTKNGSTVNSGNRDVCISSGSQSSIADFFRLTNGEKPQIPERSVINNTIIPKTQHSTGISAIRAQLEQQSASHTPKLPMSNKPVVIHPERPPGFNSMKKPTTGSGSVVDISDDDEEVGGALSALGAAPKNADEVSAKLREAYKKKKLAPGLVSSNQLTSHQQAKLAYENEEYLMKKRLSVNSDSMFKELLSWDFFGSIPPALNKSKSVPNKFTTVDEYRSIMEPLLYLEAWQQIQNTKLESRNNKLFTFSIVFGKRVKVDDFIDVYVSISKKSLAEAGLQDSDLLVIAYDPAKPGEIIESTGSIPHCFAKVKEGTIKYGGKEFVDFQIRMTDNKGFLAPLSTGSVVSCCSVGSITTIEREFTSLMALPYYGLRDNILNAKPAIAADSESQIENIQKNQNLNRSQATAVTRSLNNHGFSLIQGPPGTGKTKTIISIVGSFFTNSTMISTASGGDVATGKRILICAPSNAAVDEIVLRLKDGVIDGHGKSQKLNILRLGRLEKVSEHVKELTLESLVVKEVSAAAETVDGQLRRDHTALIGKRQELRSKLAAASEDGPDNNKSVRLTVEEVRKLESELKAVGVKIREKQYALDMQRDRLEKARKQRDVQFRKQQFEILSNAQVVCTTLSASVHPLLVSMGIRFETVIIDEAAQCIELSALIPMRYGCRNCIMVGDPNQLPPTVLSPDATRLKYNQSLFVRMFDQWKDVPGAICMLDTQFRMHPEISRFPSKEFYKGMLKDGFGLAEKLSRPWHRDLPSLGPYTFFNIAGKHVKGGSLSLLNKEEAKFALQLVQYLTEKYPNCGSIGVITPYKEQVNYMRRLFIEHMGSEILSLVNFNSVDGFQGQEKDIIIMSCVRASDSKTNSIGFLSDVRRLNVAVTRAKTSLWILGRASSLSVNPVWKALIEDASNRSKLIDTVPGHFRRSIEKRPSSKVNDISSNSPQSRASDHLAGHQENILHKRASEDHITNTPQAKRIFSGDNPKQIATSSSAKETREGPLPSPRMQTPTTQQYDSSPVVVGVAKSGHSDNKASPTPGAQIRQDFRTSGALGGKSADIHHVAKPARKPPSLFITQRKKPLNRRPKGG